MEYLTVMFKDDAAYQVKAEEIKVETAIGWLIVSFPVDTDPPGQTTIVWPSDRIKTVLLNKDAA